MDEWEDEPGYAAGRDWAIVAALDLALLIGVVVILAMVFL